MNAPSGPWLRPPPYGSRLLANGMALTGRTVHLLRGHRRQVDFAAAAGLSRRTVHRMEEKGATLTQALALAGAELGAGSIQNAAYVISMIGESLPLAPAWAEDRWRTST